MCALRPARRSILLIPGALLPALQSVQPSSKAPLVRGRRELTHLLAEVTRAAQRSRNPADDAAYLDSLRRLFQAALPGPELLQWLQSPPRARPSPFPGVGYRPEGGSSYVEIAWFHLRQNAIIPLHNHPAMSAFQWVASGRAETTKWSIAGISGASAMLLPAGVRRIGEGATDSLNAARANVHSVRAIEESVLLDISAPPYDRQRQRDTLYFKVDDRSRRNSSAPSKPGFTGLARKGKRGKIGVPPCDSSSLHVVLSLVHCGCSASAGPEDPH